MMEFLLNNSRAKPSISNILLDPIKTPINRSASLYSLPGGTEACLRSPQPYIPLIAQNKQLQPLNP